MCEAAVIVLCAPSVLRVLCEVLVLESCERQMTPSHWQQYKLGDVNRMFQPQLCVLCVGVVFCATALVSSHVPVQRTS